MSGLRIDFNVAVAFFVKEDATLSIIQVKKIHPPAHIVVVSEEYDGYDELYGLLDSAKSFEGYHSNKARNDGMIDYTIKCKERHIKNEKLNSYKK